MQNEKKKNGNRTRDGKSVSQRGRTNPGRKTSSTKTQARGQSMAGTNRSTTRQNSARREAVHREKPMTKKELRQEEKRKAKEKRAVNKEFGRVTYTFIALFLCLMGYIVYFNVVEAKNIINSPHNTRLDSMADRVIRGNIVDKKGKILAETKVAEDGTETREYPYGKIFAQVVGYDVYGKSGLESKANFELLTSNAFIRERMQNELQDKKNPGDTVVTTLDAKLQETAYEALGDSKGAVVVVESSTGKILTMVSKPSFNPEKVEKNWDKLNSDENSPMLNRATQGLYAPGSTFKILTTLEFMQENPNYNNYTYTCKGHIKHDGTKIECFDGTVHGKEDLESSFANSCNSSFANIGLQISPGKYRTLAENLLFNSKLPCPLPYSQSKFRIDQASTSADMMMTAMGQGQTLVSPYHMALITAAVANGGTLMKPYLIDKVTNVAGTEVDGNMPESYGELMTSREAAVLSTYMRAVVKEGTGRLLNGQSYSVAGKTGTAEYSSDKNKSHSWFVGFTNVDNPELVISVIVESADTSGVKAVAIAKKVFDAYY